jgi:hypothetical protein
MPKQPLSLDAFLSEFGQTRESVIEARHRGKAGRGTPGDFTLAVKMFHKIKAKKWSHLQAEYHALETAGNQRAIAEVNPLASSPKPSRRPTLFCVKPCRIVERFPLQETGRFSRWMLQPQTSSP